MMNSVGRASARAVFRSSVAPAQSAAALATCLTRQQGDLMEFSSSRNDSPRRRMFSSAVAVDEGEGGDAAPRATRPRRRRERPPPITLVSVLDGALCVRLCLSFFIPWFTVIEGWGVHHAMVCFCCCCGFCCCYLGQAWEAAGMTRR